MKHIPLIALIFLLSSPAFAAETAKPAKDGTPVPAAAALAESDDADMGERMALAQKMHEIWPVRTRIESAINAVSQSFPPEKQAQVKASMRKGIQFDQVEEASIKAMANTYTKEELKAMIDFYGSENGIAISAKTADYEMAMRPVMVEMMDKAMLDLKLGTTP